MIGRVPPEDHVSPHLAEIIASVAPADLTVLISGETGVGKEVVARALHRRSKRRDGPFVKVNCTALPPALLESELFGYAAGTFPGALWSKRGRLEEAERGTILLDEIGAMPLSVQAKMVRVLRARRYSRLGSRQETKVKARVLATTSLNLSALVACGEFRDDLCHQLDLIHVRVPALRLRKEEIGALTDYFLGRGAPACELAAPVLSPATRERFATYPWPGNVRELENIVTSIAVLGSDDWVVRELDGRQQGRAPQGRACPLGEIRAVRAAPVDVR